MHGKAESREPKQGRLVRRRLSSGSIRSSTRRDLVLSVEQGLVVVEHGVLSLLVTCLTQGRDGTASPKQRVHEEEYRLKRSLPLATEPAFGAGSAGIAYRRRLWLQRFCVRVQAGRPVHHP